MTPEEKSAWITFAAAAITGMLSPRFDCDMEKLAEYVSSDAADIADAESRHPKRVAVLRRTGFDVFSAPLQFLRNLLISAFCFCPLLFAALAPQSNAQTVVACALCCGSSTA